MIALAPAAEPDVERLLDLREEAAAWMRAETIRQWEPGEVRVEQIRAQVDAGEWFVHRPCRQILGALRLLWSDPAVWGDGSDDAAYVHGLVIDRRAAGADLGGRLLAWADEQARRAGRPFLRLDCVETDGRLRRYYRDHGFRESGRRDLPGPWHAAVLFEKSLEG